MINLTKFCLTFPELLEPQISRRNTIDWLHDRFSNERKVIIVQGIVGSGKTTLLAQFAQLYSDCCICYFIKQDVWSLDPQRFLQEMCEQIYVAIHGNPEGFSLPDDYYNLKYYFNKLYSSLSKRVKDLRKSFFLVVDGLEWVKETNGQDSILDILPHDPLPGIYLLASSNIDQDIDFSFDKIAIQFLGPSDVEIYFQHHGINDKEFSNKIFDVCGGMPGYLDQIRREYESGTTIEELNQNNLPKGFQELLEREWEKIRKSDKCILEALAICTYSDLPINLNDLAKITDIDPLTFESCLGNINYLHKNSSNVMIFVTDAHKKFFAEKLINLQLWAENTLIEFYELNPLSDSALAQLPILYRKARKIERFRVLLNIKNMTSILQKQKDIMLLRNILRKASDTALINKDWQSLSISSLLSSALKTMIVKTPLESEVHALLLLGDYKRAIGIAYQATLPEDKLFLLSIIITKIQKENSVIPNDVYAEIDRLIDLIIPSSYTSDKLIDIAANLFYTYTKAAISLVDKVSNIRGKGKSLDILLAVISMRMDDEDIPNQKSQIVTENIRSRISDRDLREFARVTSPLISKLHPHEIINEIEKIDDISSKIYMLRSWCNSNRDNPNSYIVIGKALDLISDNPKTPSMRHLRQFAAALESVEPIYSDPLIKRLDILKDTAIKKPEEEKIRLELCLAEIESKTSIELANDRMTRIIFELDDINDLDAICYSYIQILQSIDYIDRDDPLQLRKSITKKLEYTYNELLNSTADHFTITKKILRSLASFNPEMAYKFSGKLNTILRRDSGYNEIIKIYLKRDHHKIDFDFLEKLLNSIDNNEIQDKAVVNVLSELNDKEFHHSFVQKTPQLKERIDKLKRNPINYCIALSYWMLLLHKANQGKVVENTFRELIDNLMKVDSLWDRVHIGFEITSILANTLQEKANNIRYCSGREITPSQKDRRDERITQ